jgi:hypothetical protein
MTPGKGSDEQCIVEVGWLQWRDPAGERVGPQLFRPTAASNNPPSGMRLLILSELERRDSLAGLE